MGNFEHIHAVFQPLEVSGVHIPEKFTYPFCYDAHPLAKRAAADLQTYLEQHIHHHNFGLDPSQAGLVIGKMFGVLVVQTSQNQYGYIAAYSGKLADGSQHPRFVPSVFDIYKDDDFYRAEERILVEYNKQIESLENSENYLMLKEKLAQSKQEAEQELKIFSKQLKELKKERQTRREAAKDVLDEAEFEHLLEGLKNESLKQQYDQKMLIKVWNEKISVIQNEVQIIENQIQELKELRAQKSATVQAKLFDNYKFLNAQHEWKSLLAIFNKDLGIQPPAGAGECAAPKLLHYAYLNQLKPIALAEFWWGQSPKSEVRKHKDYYPACKSKCGPILGFMLQGLAVEPNPLEQNPAEGKELEVIYEDDYLMIINKPSEFLSVPGKLVTDSVQERIQKLHPEATLVHRLDQSTSGIILIAKNHEIHARLQQQFIKRSVKKRYVALLNGIVEPHKGLIDLPLRVDLDNRPQQMVCYNYGKPAQTTYEVVHIKDGITKVHFYPITGRTHQLRVHASHSLGLNAAIVGDDIYGTRADRLYLHAEYLEFTHPVSKERISFTVDAGF